MAQALRWGAPGMPEEVFLLRVQEARGLWIWMMRSEVGVALLIVAIMSSLIPGGDENFLDGSN